MNDSACTSARDQKISTTSRPAKMYGQACHCSCRIGCTAAPASTASAKPWMMLIRVNSMLTTDWSRRSRATRRSDSCDMRPPLRIVSDDGQRLFLALGQLLLEVMDVLAAVLEAAVGHDALL